MNTVVFKLRAKCERIPGTKKDDPEHVAMRNANVYSSHLTWDPKGEQAQNWKGAKPKPVLDDILLAKLRPGQEIHLELHCEKGIGKDHAKFSPVATASYRLLPHIEILAPIPPEHAQKFIGCFPEGVVGVRRKKGGKKDEEGGEEVYIKDARRDTVSREVLRHKEFEGKVRLGRVRDHFLFDIESTGIYKPEDLLPAALRVLAEKLKVVRQGAEALQAYHGEAP